MSAGLTVARSLLLEINSIGLPVATEMLDTISPQYLDDQISLATIGARTSLRMSATISSVAVRLAPAANARSVAR